MQTLKPPSQLCGTYCPCIALQVLGFPCNQFGGQEPGSNDDIKAFAAREYGVTFPLFSKVEVNGPNASPIFTFLRDNSPNSQDTQWNFEKVSYAHPSRAGQAPTQQLAEACMPACSSLLAQMVCPYECTPHRWT